jgi:hypothetical protein
MKDTMKHHIEELQTSASRMLVLNSDNSMLISYFKDLKNKLEYLYELNEIDNQANWTEIQNAFNSILKIDTELTEVDLKIKVKEAPETKTGKITIKMY